MNPLIQESIDIAPSLAGDGMGAIAAVIAGLIFVFAIVFIVLYVYMAFALMTIAQKTKTENPWLAWIPIANLYLLSRIAKMHWWPLLLVVVYMFFSVVGSVVTQFTEWGLIFTGISAIFQIVFAVYVIIWFWKMFEAVNRPGWWALFNILPVLNIVFFVLLGVAAWGTTPEDKK